MANETKVVDRCTQQNIYPPPTCLLTNSHVKPLCCLIEENVLDWYFGELAIVHPSLCVMH